MKRNFIELASVIGLALLSQNLKADTLVGPGGAWQPWTAAVLGPASSPTYTSSTNPGPYWNHFSGDGPTANIGWCLAGGGSCVITSPPGAIAYYGTASGAAIQNMALVSSGLPATVTMLNELTNQLGVPPNSGYNVLGFYTINPNGVITAVTPLWNSQTGSVGQSATFNPGPAGTLYGLYVENIQGAGTPAVADYFWFMNSSSDHGTGTAPAVDSLQHFAVFADAPDIYLMGVDDTNNGNQDYNNLIIELVTAPEPRTVALLGIGLLLCGFTIHRRRKLTAAA